MNRLDAKLHPPNQSAKRVAVLGSTGSIGVNALEVIEHLGLQLIAISGHSNLKALVEQAHRYKPHVVCITDTKAAREIDASDFPPNVRLLRGSEAVCGLVGSPEIDVVVNAVVGAAGLMGTWAALEAGNTVALANKETLVVAGPLIMKLLGRGGRILPVDSEHSAIFQALNGSQLNEVRRVVLTASGGPFRNMTWDQLHDVTPDDALQHPTWKMGPKITIDSATLMNKALEVIEARWLFDLPPEKIGVVIHPESIVHSFVEFEDGSILAQLSPPDMRLPIQYALTYPHRQPGPARKLDWTSIGTMHFEQPDRSTFPALDLGYEVAERGGTCGAVLNAANEVAVGRFLAGELGFLDIPRVCREVLAHHHFLANPSLEELWAADRTARNEVNKWTHNRAMIVSP